MQPAATLSSETTASREDVLKHVDAICRHPSFAESLKCQEFLRFIVGAFFDGSADTLKERLIGIQLYRKESLYDTAGDPIVRVRANEVRRRLAAFYDSEAGSRSALRVTIPTGGYVPRIQNPIPASLELPTSPARTPNAFPKPVGPWAKLALGLVAALATMILLAGYPWRPGHALDAFWAPWLGSGKSVVVCTGNIRLFYLSPALQDRLRGAPPAAVSSSRDEWAKPSDFLVSRGNFHAASDLIAYLSGKGERVDTRVGHNLTMNELAESPVILLGAFSNVWTVELNNSLRFRFLKDNGAVRGRISTIQDRDNPHRVWTAPDFPDPITLDYALVTRLRQPKTGRYIAALGGISQFGTQAAGHFLTDKVALSRFAAGLPKDWADKNLQVLLATKVVDNTPMEPTVLAWHIW